MSDVFQALAPPARRAILDELQEPDGRTLFELCARLTMRLTGLGMRVTQPAVRMGPVRTAVLDDTCGNLVQIAQMTGA